MKTKLLQSLFLLLFCSTTLTTWSQNSAGKAMQITSIANVAVVPNDSLPASLLSSFTIDCWIKPMAAEEMTIVSKGTPMVNGFGFGYNANKQLYLDIYGVTQITVDSILNPLMWHHVAVSVTSSNVTFFTNGKVVKSLNGAFVLQNNTDPLLIGGRKDYQFTFNGEIDELRIYSAPLNIETLQLYMHNRVMGSEPALVAAYNFDEALGNVFLDIKLKATATSQLASRVTSNAWRPIVIEKLDPASRCINSSTAFGFTVSSTANTTYQWYKNNVVISDDGNYQGTNTMMLIINRIEDMHGGAYFLKMTNQTGSYKSENITLYPIQPPVAYGGEDIYLTEGKVIDTVVVLNAQPAGIEEVGSWSDIFENTYPENPHSHTLNAFGEYTFLWTVLNTSSACFSIDTVKVYYRQSVTLEVTNTILAWGNVDSWNTGEVPSSATVVVMNTSLTDTITVNIGKDVVQCSELVIGDGQFVFNSILPTGSEIQMGSLTIGKPTGGRMGRHGVILPASKSSRNVSSELVVGGGATVSVTPKIDGSVGNDVNIGDGGGLSIISNGKTAGIVNITSGSLNIEPAAARDGRPGSATVRVGAGGSLNIEPDPNKSNRPNNTVIKVGAGGSLNIEPDPNKATTVNAKGKVLVSGGSLNIEPDPNKNTTFTDNRGALVTMYDLVIDTVAGRPAGSVRVGAGGSLNIEPDPNRPNTNGRGGVIVRGGSLNIEPDPNRGRGGYVAADSISVTGGEIIIQADTLKATGRVDFDRPAGALRAFSLNIEPDPNRPSATVKVGAGGSLNIEPDPNRPAGSRGGILVKGGSLNIEPDPNRGRANVSASSIVVSGGSLNIEPDPNRSDVYVGERLGVVTTYSLNIEPDPNKDGRPGAASVRVGAGGSLNIEPDPNRALSNGHLKVGAGGSLNIEPDPNRGVANVFFKSGHVAGGSLNIEPDPNKATRPGSAVVRTHSLNIEPDPNKTGRPSAATVKVGAGGSLNIEPDPNKTLDGNIRVKSGGWVSIEKGGKIQAVNVVSTSSGNVILDHGSSLIDLNDTNSVLARTETFVPLQNSKFTTFAVPFDAYKLTNPDFKLKYFSQNSGWSDFDYQNTEMSYNNGYMALSSSADTVSVDGSLKSGSSDVTNLGYSGTDANAGWHFIGNPYASSFDWRLLSANRAIYTFDGSNYGVWVDNIRINNGSPFIKPVGSFFIRNEKDETTSINFVNTARVHYSPEIDTVLSLPANVLRLRVAGANGTDETVVRFNANATNGFDKNMDAYKPEIIPVTSPQLYTLSDDKTVKYTVNSRPGNAEEKLMIPVHFTVSENGDYTFTMPDNTFDSKVEFWLYDTKAGGKNNLSKGSYTFNYQTTDAADRFTLWVNPQVSATKSQVLHDEFSIAYTDGKLLVYNHSLSSSAVNVSVFNMLGAKVAQQQIHGAVGNININVPTGVYVVRCEAGTQVATQRIIINR